MCIVAHDLVHAGQRLGRLVDHEVGALGHDLELVVGDERGDLDDDVAAGSSPVISRSIHTSTAAGYCGRCDGGCAGRPMLLDVPVVRLDPDLAARLRPARRRRARPRRPGGRRAAPPGGGRALVPTGIAVALPEGYAGFVQPRSGLALRHGVTCLNTPGLIDAGYRDELKVLLVNTDPTEAFEVHRGDRIAQLVVQAVAHVAWAPVAELPGSGAGRGGFGHTGR